QTQPQQRSLRQRSFCTRHHQACATNFFVLESSAYLFSQCDLHLAYFIIILKFLPNNRLSNYHHHGLSKSWIVPRYGFKAKNACFYFCFYFQRPWSRIWSKPVCPLLWS